ncbi:DUF5681 domain-containing protein [Prolixibacteraceae bacterium Z1-6]|uniref:DUF5681 domain-containing protein n=1 Tax=Draconibacterium aestuarii TaxID=2998507 RepID=A0A9X3F3J7_9BACT|nr:DUF5681 domain-containing protein [Prolixibacteraceae bacterium Z1-6]
MAFQKGQSGNPIGRKRGIYNKSTQEFRDFIKEVIASNYTKNKVAKDLKELSPKTRLEILLKLLDFVLPKLSPTEVTEQSNSGDFFANVANLMKRDNSTSQMP